MAVVGVAVVGAAPRARADGRSRRLRTGPDIRHRPRAVTAAPYVRPQEHTPSGRHRTVSVPFDEWLPPPCRDEAAGLSHDEALGAFPPALHATLVPPSPG